MDHLYKFRIFPSCLQAEQIEDTFSCCTYVYNYFLEVGRVHRVRGLGVPGYVAATERLQRMMDENEWLRAVDPVALRNAAGEALSAYKAYILDPGSGKPKAKTHEDSRKAYVCSCGYGMIRIGDGIVHIPYLGDVECTVTQTSPVDIVAASIMENVAGTYQIAVHCLSGMPADQAPDAYDMRFGLSISYFDPLEYAESIRRRRRRHKEQADGDT